MSKTNSHKDDNFILKIIAWSLLALALVLMSVSLGYYFGYETGKEEIILKEKQKEQRRLSLLEKIEKTTYKGPDTVNARLKKVLKKETLKQKKIQTALDTVKNNEKKITQTLVKKKSEVIQAKANISASHEYESEALAKPPKRVARKVRKVIPGKPKLAIIIDDVSVASHVNAIKSLGLHVTMSFLPPSKYRPNSPKLAAKEKFYMVHLPLEARNYTAEEPYTLRVSHSQKEVSKRVQKIKKLFPKVRYINNHTGSKYTADEVAMNKLVLSLNSHNISFIDSRTTAKTKVPKVMRNFGMKYVARDIFLDHEMDKKYIIGQIKKAIRIAKLEGIAIAIGHPHSNTILALHESKKLFKEVDLVFINEIY